MPVCIARPLRQIQTILDLSAQSNSTRLILAESSLREHWNSRAPKKSLQQGKIQGIR
jgi:hypothetical protein